MSRRRGRTDSGLFLAEGRQCVGEALRRTGTVVDLLVADSALERHRDLVEQAQSAGVRVGAVAARTLEALADTVSPQGLIGICRGVGVPLAAALSGEPRLVVLCARVRDPGNLGTVIRCADAFGADAVLVSSDSVDVFNAKTVRASTGSIFHLPIAVDVHLGDAVHQARAAGLHVLGADGAAPASVEELRLSGELARPTMWVLGNEAWGLPVEDASLLDRLVALPIFGQAESLNLSAAAAVLLYATATAQRDRSGPQTRSPAEAQPS